MISLAIKLIFHREKSNTLHESTFDLAFLWLIYII